MRKVRITESQLKGLVRKLIKEENSNNLENERRLEYLHSLKVGDRIGLRYMGTTRLHYNTVDHIEKGIVNGKQIPYDKIRIGVYEDDEDGSYIEDITYKIVVPENF
jgi:hypothetical protein